MVERPRKRNHSTRRNSPISRFEANASAERRRFANRSGRIGSNRGIAQSGSNCGSRSSRRSSGDMLRVPRIVNLPEETHQRTPAVGELMQIAFAQNHGSSLPQPSHDLRILGGNPVLKDSAGRGGADAGSIDEVFECNWDSVQWPAPLTASNLLFRRPCLGQGRFGRDSNKSIQCGIELFNALQAHARQLNRRNFFSPQPRGKLKNG